MRNLTSCLVVAALWLVTGAALADEAGASASVSLGGADADASSSGEAAGGGGDRADRPWIDRWAPEAGMAELGLYLGLFLPADELELFEPRRGAVRQGQLPFRNFNPDFGLRAGYYPLRFLGGELEGGLMLSETPATGDSATLYTVRAHLVGQLGLWSVTPFALLGGGLLGVSSDAVGGDVDAAMHWGLGVKVFVSRHVMLRLDLRDIVAGSQGSGASGDNWEILLGGSLTLGREEPAPPVGPVDTDGDNFTDPHDACPAEPGIAPDGCPPRDTDGDGLLDPQDECVKEPGPADNQGCPLGDRDGDGVPDRTDECPDEAGVAPSGCPPDADKDGIVDAKDKCVNDPETKNGFEDQDGCPDELPKEVKAFTGVIKGIFFDLDKATIKEASNKQLDKAVEVLSEYPDLKIEISGHTDNTGTVEHNKTLSMARADAVKAYLVGKGVAEDRIATRGAGSDEPIDDNAKAEGRAKNRRIEFAIQK
jgi:OOP family OmpA-OmpF porin